MSSNQRTGVRAGWLIAYQDGEHRVVRDGMLVYEGSRIVEVARAFRGTLDREIDARDKIVAPGFVTAHAHITDSPPTKSFIEDRGNRVLWMSGLYEFLQPLWRRMTPDMIRASARFSLLEMLQTGTTTVMDVGTALADEVVDLIGEVGIRAYVAPFFRSATWRVVGGHRVEYDWVDAAEEDRQLTAAVTFADRHDGAYDGRVRTFMAPAQVDTCRPELLRRTQEIARARGAKIHLHAGQSVVEFHEMLRRSGKTPVGYLADLGLLGPDLILGHCIFTGGHSWLGYTDDEDLRLLAESGTTVAHCPWVFARRGIALESVARYADAGVRVCLGTDTFPQNMLFEMRVGASVGKLADRDTEVARAADMFAAATLGGARALGRDDLGRLAPGAKADFVAYRTDSLSMAPVRDPIRNLVYSAERGDVDRVVIDGRDVLVDGRVEGLDEPALARDVQHLAEELWQALGRDGEPSAEEISPSSLQAFSPPDES